MDIKIFSSDFFFLKNSDSYEFIKILGCCLTNYSEISHYKFDFCIWMFKEIIEEILRVYLWASFSHNFFLLFHKFFYILDDIDTLFSCLFYCNEHKKYPLFPRVICTHFLQKFIVFRFMSINISTQIKNRKRQESFFYQIEYIDNATSTAVTIIKWMYTFKLMMYKLPSW